MATVANTSRSNTINLASTGAGPFNVGFRLFRDNSVQVFVDGVENEDYTLTVDLTNGYDDNATITFDSSITAPATIVIYGDQSIDRQADYSNTEPNLTGKLNTELPDITAAVKELQEKNGRALRFPFDVDVAEGEASDFASKLVVFGAGGTTLAPSLTVADLESLSTSAAASAAAASGSADDASDSADDAATSASEAASRIPYADVAAATAATIPAEAVRITTHAYASGVSTTAGGATYVRSSSGEVAGYPALAWFQSADGAYWLLDEKRPTVAMFGARADMTYSTVFEPDQLLGVGSGESGFVMDAGTDCRAAVVAGDAYAAAAGTHLWFEPGGYFLDCTTDGEIEPTARWMSTQDFGATLWIDYNKDGSGIHQSGIKFGADYTGLGTPDDHGFKLIGQFSSITLKPSGRGHQGTIWRTGEYYTSTTQPILKGICVRALMCRAALARTSGGSITQRSIGSILAAAMGGLHDDYHFALGVFGVTNISSGRALLVHWGCQADLTGYDLALDDLSTATITETYHAFGGTIRWLTDIDNRDGHEITQTWEMAGAYGFDVGPLTSWEVHGGSGALGGGAGGVTCGDVVDAFICDEQAGLSRGPGLVRFQNAFETDMIDGAEAFYIKGSGTGKATTDVYSGTSVGVQRHQDGYAVEVEGIRVTCKSGHDRTLGRGVFIEDVLGTVRMGTVETYGVNRGIEFENCHGHFEVARHAGDGAFINNFSDCVVVHDAAADRLHEANSADTDNYAEGYQSANSRAVEVVGREAVLQDSGPANITVSGAHAIGATTISLSAAIDNYAVAEGDTLLIGTNRLKAASRTAIGALTIEVSPLLTALAGGETITLVERAVLKGRFRFASSNLGIVVGKHGELEGDISEIAYTGKHAVKATDNAVVRIIGGEMPFVGRSSTALTNRRTIRAEDEAQISLRGVTVRDNPTVTTHVQLTGDSSLLVDGCVIEDVTSFANAVTNEAQISWGENFDLTGAKISHPGLDLDWTPVLERDTTGTTGITTTTGYARSSVMGEWVHVTFEITVTAFPAGTGEYLLVTGMPIAILQDGIGQLTVDNGTGSMSPPSNGLFLMADAGTDELRFFRQATSGETTLKDTELGNGNIMRGSIWYRWR